MRRVRQIAFEHRYFIICLIVILSWLAYWMIANVAPPPWDESWYLQTSVDFYRALHQDQVFQFLATLQKPGAVVQVALRQGQAFQFLATLMTAFGGTKAPLLSLLPLPIYLLFGTAYGTVIATNVIVFGLGILVLYAYVRKVWGLPQAILAVVIFSTMPVVYGVGRQFLVETGLTGLVVLWMYLLHLSGGLKKGSYDNWFGVVLGLGLLDKVSFPLYVVGPTLYFLFTAELPVGVALRRVWRVFWIGLLVAAVWYAPNARTVVHYAISAGYGSIGANYSYGSPFALATIARYLQVVANYATSVYYAVAVVAALAVAAINAAVRRRIIASPRQVSATLWFLVPFVIFLFGENKDFRFLLPCLPAVAILLANSVWAIRGSRMLRLGAIALLLAGPLGLALETTLPSSASRPSVVLGGWVLAAEYVGYATPPDAQNWPIRAILTRIEYQARVMPTGTMPLVLLVVDNPEFNQNNFSYYADAAGYNLDISAVLTASPADRTVALQRMMQAQFLITKTGNQGPTFTTSLNAEFRRLLRRGALPFRPLATFRLPDGSTATVYESENL